MSEYWKVAIRGNIAGAVEWRNIFYYENGGTPVTASALAAALLAQIYTPRVAIMSTFTHITGADLALYTAGAPYTNKKGWDASVFVPLTLSGTDAGSIMPTFNAAVLIGLTGVKHVRARKFIPVFGESYNEGNNWNAGTQTALTAMATAWASVLTVSGQSLYAQSWGPKHGFVVITSARADAAVGVIRRRKIGLGI